ncbi:MAG TPA: hypothetical protein VGI03_03775 [Verrucomicrobiae bacterium]|jgi:hypothetical protein
MNATEQSCWKQKAGQFFVQAVGNVATFLLATILLMAWAVTSPLFKLGDSLAENWRRRKSTIIKEHYE